MNSFWTFLDWILPSVRLSDDLDDAYALADDAHSVADPHPRIRGHDPRRDWAADRDRELERDRDRQRIQSLERENAALYQRVAALERDVQAARQSLAAFSLQPEPSTPPQIYRPSTTEPANRTSYDSLLASYTLTRRTLHDRTEEVASLKSFLSKTDEWSGAQLIQAIRDLNSEIVQLAASVAEEFASALDRRLDLSRQSDRDLVNTALGPVMMNLLVTRDHAGDPTLVQFAIQAWEVCCVGRVLDSFCFGLPSDIDQFLTNVFEHMHHAEPQPTTSRWRALTYMHSRALLTPPSRSSTPPPSSMLSLNETNLRGLLAILALSGCTDSRGVHRDPLRTRYGGAIARIGERVERIVGVIKEGVMSGVFEVTWVAGKGVASNASRKDKERDRWFDWASMENIYAGHGSEQSKVLCTVELGLACVRRVGWAGGSAEQDQSADARGKVNGHGGAGLNGNGAANGASSEGTLNRSVLLKPKVLLESITDIL
ncbi:uncharacterized protein FIBRA_00784 [Fibroporia radiculosa]|uniref:Uncharacterized protein n=1 Tax=Fibroporia radiculosa TaxID=599839 RepID=J4H0P9_9APHY|nr:uncharacterized protein FIBRA_00784 [Fibroporia radiculosa]CCL98779.1 predicted protein [Fibroporia radiculosa]